MTSSTESQDREILRDLARRFVEVCAEPSQRAKRQHWRELNSLRDVPPPIYIRACAFHEMPQSRCLCQDPFYRPYEHYLRAMLFQATLGDDFIFEPWLTVQAVCITPPRGLWGLPTRMVRDDTPGGAGHWDPPIREPGGVAGLVRPQHRIDEAATAANLARLQEAIGDIITVTVDRAPAWRMWSADLSTDLGSLRGIEQLMYDMMDRPQWLHDLLAFMRDGVLRAHQQAEDAGDWRLCDHQNQAMPYSLELSDPAADPAPVGRKQLWGYAAAQELTLVGPDQFEEFMWSYQRPLLEPFGLAAYGCCEDLTRKIPLLRKLKNLRRISVSPFANVARCAEQIGRDYVISYRPSPADMVSYGLDRDKVRAILRRDMQALRGCHFDITLKDVETVQKDPNRVRNWVALVRELIEETST